MLLKNFFIIISILVLFQCREDNSSEPNQDLNSSNKKRKSHSLSSNSNIQNKTNIGYIKKLVVGCKEICPKNRHTKLDSHTVDITNKEKLYTQEQEEEYMRTGKILSIPSERINPPTYLLDIREKRLFEEKLLNSHIFKKNGLYEIIIFEYLPREVFIDTVFQRFNKILKKGGKLKILGLPSYLLRETSKKAVGPIFWSTYDSSQNKNFISKFSIPKGYKFNIKDFQIYIKGAPYYTDIIRIETYKNIVIKINKIFETYSAEKIKDIKRKNDIESKIIIKNYFYDIGFELKETNMNQKYLLLEKFK